MAELQALETWANELIQKLNPTQRNRMLWDVARRLRTDNAQRMRAQTDPDGNRWEARKAPNTTLRSQRQKLRQKAKQRQPMFAKLRQQKNLKASRQGDTAVVDFANKAQRIARVHHFGETDAVSPGGPQYKYPARELIGISESDNNQLRDALLSYLKA